MSRLRIAGMALAVIIPIAAAVVPLAPGKSSGARNRDTLGLYEGYATPEWILKGIARTESGERDRAIGDDGISLGRMQLNSRFAVERYWKYGDFNPFDAEDAVRITSCIYQENLKKLGDPYAAIAAHRLGVTGVREHGYGDWYVMRVWIKGHE